MYLDQTDGFCKNCSYKCAKCSDYDTCLECNIGDNRTLNTPNCEC